jgi:hypothetical protein
MRQNNHQLFTIILFISIFFISIRPIADPDFWWHLKTGEILLSTGAIPKSDPFSFTRLGEPWIAHEWLSELVIYFMYDMGNYYLLILFFSGIITLSFYLAYIRSPGKPYYSGFIILLSALVSAPTWGVRPQIISLLFTSIFLLILDIYQEKRNWQSLGVLPVITMLWVNFHGGYIIGIMIIGIYIIGEIVHLLSVRLQKEKTSLRYLIQLCCALFACIVFSILNPNGFEILSYPFKTLFSPSMMYFIQEWFSPDFHKIEWIPLSLLLLALIATPTIFRRRGRLTRLLLVLFFTFFTFRSMRFAPMLALVAIPFLSEQLEGVIVRTRPFNYPSIRKIINTSLIILFCCFGGLYSYSVFREQPATEEKTFPKNAVDWIITNKPEGTMFNSYGWGGYLIWRLYPKYLVFIDGRADIYGDQFIYSYMQTYSGQPGWEDNLERSGVRFVLIEPGSGLSNVLLESSDWKVAYEDTLSILFLKK